MTEDETTPCGPPDERLVELGHRMFDLAREGDETSLLAYVDGGVPVDLTDAQGNPAALESTGLHVGKASIGVVVTGATTTLANLSSAVNALDMGISALALDVGPDDGPSSLVLSSRSTGADHALTADFSHLGGFDGHPVNELRAAQDARLLLGDGTVATPRLTVPHAALTQRRFVLVPLLELDFAAALPDGTRLADVLARLPLDEDVRRDGPPLAV